MLPNPDLQVAKLNGVNFNKWDGVGKSNLYLVNTLEEWRAFYALMKDQDLVAWDTETTGFDWHAQDRIVGMSFGWKLTHVYVPLRHEESLQDGPPPPQIDIEDIRADLVEFFSKPTRMLLTANAKFDAHFLAKEGLRITCKIHDVLIMWKLYDENAPGALKVISSGWRDVMGRWHKGVVDGAANLKETEISDWRIKESRTRRDAFRSMVMAEADLLEKGFAYQHMTRNDLKKHIATTLFANHKYAKSGKEDIHYGMIPVWLMTEYAALDTFLTYKVYEYCVKKITWTPGIVALYKNEMQLMWALFDAEEHGMRIDRVMLEAAGVDLQTRIDSLDARVRGVLGNCNLRSHPQLVSALQAQGVVFTKFTETTEDLEDEEDKKYALDKKVLEKLKGQYEIVKDILELRAAQKIKGTYVDNIMLTLSPDSVIHCSFNQNVSTGRMSGSAPNLQNLPARNKTIRKAFIPWSDEFLFVFADYSQIEVRLTAHFSQDPLLLDAYAKNQDIHTRTYCEVFNQDLAEITEILKDESHPRYREVSLMRSATKRIVFGIIYGVGAAGLSEQIDRPDQYVGLTTEAWVDVCQGFIDQYLDTYVGVKRFVNKTKREVKTNKQITNYFGRIRHLPHIDAVSISDDEDLRWMQGKASRQGVNYIVQGCQDPNAPVLTVEGYIPLNELEVHNKPALVTYTGTESNYTVLDTGLKECVEVCTSVSTGVCSTEHRFFVLNEETMDLDFVPINTLSKNDLVVAQTCLVPGKEEARVSPQMAELMGILVGDGSYGTVRGLNGTRTGVHIRNVVRVACGVSEEWADYVVALFKRVFPHVVPTKRIVKKAKGNINYLVSAENKSMRSVLTDLGLHRVVGSSKVVPSWVQTQPVAVRCAMLKGLMDTDGGINGNTIAFTNKSRQVAESVQLLLLSIGVQSKFVFDGTYCRVIIRQEHLHTYTQHVKSQLAYKHEHAVKNSTLKYTKNKLPRILLVKAAEAIRADSSCWGNLTKSQRVAVISYRMNRYAVSDMLRQCASTPEIVNILDLLNLSWAYIKTIKPVGVKSTMDLELHGDDHSYVCRGLVQHNTAADLFKVACVRIHAILKGKKSKMVNFVHDEVQLYMHKEELHLLPAIKRAMEDWRFSVPIIAEFSSSETSWGDKKAMKVEV